MPATPSQLVGQIQSKYERKAQRKKRQLSPKQLAVIEKNHWRPGKSPNPGGKPVGLSLTAIICRYATKLTDTKGPDGKLMTWAERVAFATLELAVAGHPQALKEVWERIEGKVTQTIDVNIEGQLWQRLNQGRQRITSVKVTQTEVTFDQPASTDQQVAELDSPVGPGVITIDAVSDSEDT